MGPAFSNFSHLIRSYSASRLEVDTFSPWTERELCRSGADQSTLKTSMGHYLGGHCV
jgi:hypothetical protein